MIGFKVDKKSFTLIEIMIVIAIIAIIAALTVPNIQRQRINANEAAAISGLKAIHTALETYKDIYSAFPEDPEKFAALATGASPFLPSVLTDSCWQGGCPPDYHGYRLCYSRLSNYTYECIAGPCTLNVTGTRCFRVTKSGVIEVLKDGNWTPLE